MADDADDEDDDDDAEDDADRSRAPPRPLTCLPRPFHAPHLAYVLRAHGEGTLIIVTERKDILPTCLLSSLMAAPKAEFDYDGAFGAAGLQLALTDPYWRPSLA